MRDPQNALESLIQACTVRIDGPGSSVGSGVWVSPGLVLTCAHVAHAGGVTLTWDRITMSGQVLVASPGTPVRTGELWPGPDLSLIQVDRPPDHPCAWLSDHQVNTTCQLFATGHADVWAKQSPNTAVGKYGGPAGGGWRFTDDEITLGMSGGPVLDVQSAAVVGLAKASRLPDFPVSGGLLMPLLALRHEESPVWRRMWREHDLYHSGGHSAWPQLVDDHLRASTPSRIPPTVDAREIAELLGALTQASSLRSPADLIIAAGGRGAAR